MRRRVVGEVHALQPSGRVGRQRHGAAPSGCVGVQDGASDPDTGESLSADGPSVDLGRVLVERAVRRHEAGVGDEDGPSAPGGVARDDERLIDVGARKPSQVHASTVPRRAPSSERRADQPNAASPSTIDVPARARGATDGFRTIEGDCGVPIDEERSPGLRLASGDPTSSESRLGVCAHVAASAFRCSHAAGERAVEHVGLHVALDFDRPSDGRSRTVLEAG